MGKKKQVNILLDEDIIKILQVEADKDFRTLNNYLQKIIYKHVEELRAEANKKEPEE